jgi:2-dehydropantoate 2-reductase
MKIAIMAAGAVGGYFGARLAGAGHEVHFLARGKHLEAIRAGGLRVKSDFGDMHLTSVSVSDDPSQVGPVDVILFAVKLWDTAAAARACKPMLGEDTAVISLQNGVESTGIIAEELGPEHALGGSAYISASIAEPGVIHHFGSFAKLVFGEGDNRKSERVLAFLGAGEESGIEAEIPDDMQVAVWLKFITLASMSGVTTTTRRPIGEILADPDMAKIYRDTMTEIAEVGRARGVNLPSDAVDQRMSHAASLPAAMTASTLKDLEAGGRLETPWLTGAVVRLGRESNVPVPVNETLNAVLKPYENGT